MSEVAGLESDQQRLRTQQTAEASSTSTRPSVDHPPSAPTTRPKGSWYGNTKRFLMTGDSRKLTDEEKAAKKASTASAPAPTPEPKTEPTTEATAAPEHTESAAEAPRKTLGYAMRSNARKIAEGRFSDIKVTGKTFKNTAEDIGAATKETASHVAGYVAGTNVPDHLKPDHPMYQGDDPAGQYVRMSDGMGGYQWKDRSELSPEQIAKADMPTGPSLKGDAAIAAHATAGGLNFVAKSMMGANKQTAEERMNESPGKAALQGILGSGAQLLKSAGGSVAEGLSGGLVEGDGASEAVGHLGSMAGYGVRGLAKATQNATKPAADQQRLRRHVAHLYTEKGREELKEHRADKVMPEFGAALRARNSRVALNPELAKDPRPSGVPDWAKEQYKADHPAPEPAPAPTPAAAPAKQSWFSRLIGGVRSMGQRVSKAFGRARQSLRRLWRQPAQ